MSSCRVLMPCSCPDRSIPLSPDLRNPEQAGLREVTGDCQRFRATRSLSEDSFLETKTATQQPAYSNLDFVME